MELSRPLQNLLTQARTTAVAGKTRYVKLAANIITPTLHVPVYLVSNFGRNAMFASARSDDFRITCQIQPGLYLKQVLPYKDNLKLEFIEKEDITQTSKVFRCIPLVTSDPEVKGNDTVTGNLQGMDNINLITINLQLQELGYAFLRNSFVSDSVFLMARTDDALKHALITDGSQLSLPIPDSWVGIDMPEVGDNTTTFKHIEIPDGTRLMDLPTYLQNDDKYGIYSKGLGCYFRKGLFYIFPLFKMGRYATAQRVLDIYRLPSDAVPTLETTYYTNTKSVIILSTGEAKHDSTVDINRQNNGVGKRIINPAAISGETGLYYEKGNALTTRQDSISEFQTSSRASGEEIAIYDRKPSGNVCKALSETAYNDGQLISVPWEQSNSDLIYPGMPCKYFYTQDNDVLVETEGVVLGARSQYVKNDMNIQPTFKESTTLLIFLITETQTTT